jgi:hypothetical protein
MRNITATTTVLVAVLAVFALPASASLADRKSDEQKTERPAAPAPYSGRNVIRGEIIASLADRKSDEQKTERPATPAPYSGHVVIRGEVVALDHTAVQRASKI